MRSMLEEEPTEGKLLRMGEDGAESGTEESAADDGVGVEEGALLTEEGCDDPWHRSVHSCAVAPVIPLLHADCSVTMLLQVFVAVSQQKKQCSVHAFTVP